MSTQQGGVSSADHDLDVDMCRVHPDRREVANELCGLCNGRLNRLSKRPRQGWFTQAQWKLLRGLGRPTKRMLARWPNLPQWIARAREQKAPRSRGAYTARRHKGLPELEPGPCVLAAVHDRRHPGAPYPIGGIHGICSYCHTTLYETVADSFASFDYTPRPNSIRALAVSSAPADLIERLAVAWKHGERLRTIRTRLDARLSRLNTPERAA